MVVFLLKSLKNINHCTNIVNRPRYCAVIFSRLQTIRSISLTEANATIIGYYHIKKRHALTIMPVRWQARVIVKIIAFFFDFKGLLSPDSVNFFMVLGTVQVRATRLISNVARQRYENKYFDDNGSK